MNILINSYNALTFRDMKLKQVDCASHVQTLSPAAHSIWFVFGGPFPCLITALAFDD